MLYHCPDDNNIVMPRALISIVILCFIIIMIIVPLSATRSHSMR